MTRVVRALGWTLIAFGAVVLLYVVYLLFYTNLSAGQSQEALQDQWEVEFGAAPEQAPFVQPTSDPTASPSPTSDATEQPEPGSAYAALWFERPGQDERPVHAETLYVLEGTSLDTLQRGPGHYPSSDAPGKGNFAVSGHRTTYGAPFYHLDDLQQGDRVHIVDRDQRHWVYVVREQRIVAPTDVWVIEDDALEADNPLLTLTTCHPRFSAAQRLVVWAELEGEASAAA